MYQRVHYIKYTSIYKVHVPMCPLYKVHLYIQSTCTNMSINYYSHSMSLKGLSNTRTLASSQPTATSEETQYDHTSSPSSAPFNSVIGGVGGDRWEYCLKY